MYSHSTLTKSTFADTSLENINYIVRSNESCVIADFKRKMQGYHSNISNNIFDKASSNPKFDFFILHSYRNASGNFVIKQKHLI